MQNKFNGVEFDAKSSIELVAHLKNTKPNKKCKYCGGEFSPSQYKRWHGINCKKAFAK